MKNIDDWNTKDFTDYLASEHLRLFDIPYQPYISWQREVGLIGNLIGTKNKKAQYSKRVIKTFIDECFSMHSPNSNYPHIAFSTMYTFKKDVLQRVAYEAVQASKASNNTDNKVDVKDVAEWL